MRLLALSLSFAFLLAPMASAAADADAWSTGVQHLVEEQTATAWPETRVYQAAVVMVGGTLHVSDQDHHASLFVRKVFEFPFQPPLKTSEHDIGSDVSISLSGETLALVLRAAAKVPEAQPVEPPRSWVASEVQVFVIHVPDVLVEEASGPAQDDNDLLLVVEPGVGAYVLYVVPCSSASRPCAIAPASSAPVATPATIRPSSRREKTLSHDAGVAILSVVLAVALTLLLARAFLPMALLPLFSRFQRSDILDHERRQRLFEAIRASPGIVAKELRDRAGLHGGVAQHHLDQLVHHGLVLVRRDGRTTRYFPTGQRVPVEATLAPMRARILELLRARPNQSAQALARDLGVRVQTAWEHLARLRDGGLICSTRAGRGLVWSPANVT